MQDGFIHLSHRPETLIPIGNNFYRSIANPFVVLKLDQSKLSSEVGSQLEAGRYVDGKQPSSSPVLLLCRSSLNRLPLSGMLSPQIQQKSSLICTAPLTLMQWWPSCQSRGARVASFCLWRGSDAMKAGCSSMQACWHASRGGSAKWSGREALLPHGLHAALRGSTLNSE